MISDKLRSNDEPGLRKRQRYHSAKQVSSELINISIYILNTIHYAKSDHMINNSVVASSSLLKNSFMKRIEYRPRNSNACIMLANCLKSWLHHGRSQDFFRGGTLFQKNFQKIFKQFCKKFAKNIQKIQRFFKKISKIFNKFLLKMLTIDFLSIFFKKFNKPSIQFLRV